MITEKELLTAIQECQQEPITSSKRGTLADLFIIYDHLFGEPISNGYSYDNKIETSTIEIYGDTEFMQAVNGKSTQNVMDVLSELMEATKTLHPRMYDRVIEKLRDI